MAVPRTVLDGAGLGASGALLAAAGTTWRFAGVIARGGEIEGPPARNLAHLPVLRRDERDDRPVERAWLDRCVRNRYPLPRVWTSTAKVFQFGYWTFVRRTFDVVVNGETVREGVEVTRDIDLLLAHALIGSAEGKEPRDAGCVFPAELRDIRVGPEGDQETPRVTTTPRTRGGSRRPGARPSPPGARGRGTASSG